MVPFSELMRHRLLLVTGKGGIGKSIVTAALGRMAAAEGKRVCLVESVAQGQLGPLFGQPPVAHEETRLAERLYAINLNARDNFRDYVVQQLGQRALFERVFSTHVVRSFLDLIPGLGEVLLLGRLFYMVELMAEPFDLVVLDAYASGHFLSLLTTPDAILGTQLGGPLIKETRRVRDFLADRSKCGTLVVTTPEDLAINETLEFLPRLATEAPAKVLGVIVNRAPPRDGPAETRVLTDLSGPKSPDLRLAAAFERERLMRAGQALSELRSGLVRLLADGIRVPVGFVRDWGFIDEPLSPDFGESLREGLYEPEEGGGGF